MIKNMAVRVKRVGQNASNGSDQGPEFVEVPFENRVTVVDGQEVHWAPNEVKNFADDGVGAAHAAFDNDAGNNTREDTTVGDGARS